MRKHSIVWTKGYPQILEQRIKKTSFQIIWSNHKELFLIIIGALIPIIPTIVANHINNTEQFDKQFNERKSLYIDNYLKELNQRYYLFQRLSDEVISSKKDEKNISEYSKKLDDTKIQIEVNS
ncbi:MAG: hypothetical protein ABIN13_15445, partial [Mucilaginibacter sp.]